MSYEELIKELRESAANKRLMLYAADAIEALQKDLERSKEYEAFWQKEATEALKKFQVAVASKPRWIPVTEALPKPMTYVLLVIRRMGKEYRHDPFISTGYMSINEVDWWCSHDGSCSANHVEVTHWMPLPTPPKDETE